MRLARTWPARDCSRGYTLIEVLVVVAIIGIAGAIVVPQMLQGGTLGLQAAGRMVVADLLHAQSDAIASQSLRRVEFDLNNNRYRLLNESNQPLADATKAGTVNGYVDLNADSRFQGIRLLRANFNSTHTVEFNALGSPTHGGTVDLAFNQLEYRITVSEMTGRVTISPLTAP